MGLSWNVGEALCAKILTCPDKGRPQIIHWGIYFATTPGETTLPHLLKYPKDKLWPKIEVDPKVPRATDLVTTPDNSQGAEVASLADNGCNNPPKVKKFKLTVEGVKLTTELTESYAEKGKPGNMVINDNGKRKPTGDETGSDSDGSMDDSDDTSLEDDSDLSSSSGSSLESDSSEDDSSDEESISTVGTDDKSVSNGSGSNTESMKNSDKKWTTMHKEDVQGMLNETAGFRNHYDIKKHFWSRQGELQF